MERLETFPYAGPNQHPSLVRESIEGELMARTKKVVIPAFGDESKLAIVESDLNDPAAGEVQLSVEYNHDQLATNCEAGNNCGSCSAARCGR